MRASSIVLVLFFFAGASYAEERIPVVGAEASLKWADTNPLGVSAHYIVLVYAGEELLHSQTVEAPTVKMKALFSRMGPGEYRLRIVAIDRTGSASAPSQPIQVAWVGLGRG